MQLIEQILKKLEKKTDEETKESKFTKEELAIIKKGNKVKSTFKAPE